MHVFLLCSIQISTYLSNLLMTATMFGCINRWRDISCLVEDINHSRFKYWVQEIIVIFSYTSILRKSACHFSLSVTLRKNVIKSFNGSTKLLRIMPCECHHEKKVDLWHVIYYIYTLFGCLRSREIISFELVLEIV